MSSRFGEQGKSFILHRGSSAGLTPLSFGCSLATVQGLTANIRTRSSRVQAELAPCDVMVNPTTMTSSMSKYNPPHRQSRTMRPTWVVSGPLYGFVPRTVTGRQAQRAPVSCLSLSSTKLIISRGTQWWWLMQHHPGDLHLNSSFLPMTLATFVA